MIAPTQAAITTISVMICAVVTDIFPPSSVFLVDSNTKSVCYCIIDYMKTQEKIKKNDFSFIGKYGIFKSSDVF